MLGSQSPAPPSVSEVPKKDFPADLQRIISDADEGNFHGKLEMVGGIGIWEAHPGADHQGAVFRIQSSIRHVPTKEGSCACVHYSDLILFDPNSLEVTHSRKEGQSRHRSPVTLSLEYGCVCTV